MIGVIVWSSESREKAVIWCEDQAALAYLQGRGEMADPRHWPQPGDLVELEAEMIGNLRHARKVALLSEQSRPDLPRMLEQQAGTQAAPRLKLVASRDAGRVADDGDDVAARHALRICAAG